MSLLTYDSANSLVKTNENNWNLLTIFTEFLAMVPEMLLMY